MISAKRVAGTRNNGIGPSRIGETWTKARVRAASIVMIHPLSKDPPQVPLAQHDHEIETLATNGSNEAFAECVRLWYRRWCFQYAQSHRRQPTVHGGRERPVAIVDHEAMRTLTRHTAAELLHGPLGRRMFRDVPVHDPTCADIEDEEDVRDPQRRRDR